MADAHLAGDPTIKERIGGLVKDAWERVFANEREKIVDRMASALASAIASRD